MSTLIGNGGHARDIEASGVAIHRRMAHHREWTDDGRGVLIGINDPRVRAHVAFELGVTDKAWVHPHTFIGPDCGYGYGTHVNYGVTMTRTWIGKHCTISPGVTICGDVLIGNRVLIGAGATICDRVTIPDEVKVGAGAVVLPGRTLEPGRTYVGVVG